MENLEAQLQSIDRLIASGDQILAEAALESLSERYPGNIEIIQRKAMLVGAQTEQNWKTKRTEIAMEFGHQPKQAPLYSYWHQSRLAFGVIGLLFGLPALFLGKVHIRSASSVARTQTNRDIQKLRLARERDETQARQQDAERKRLKEERTSLTAH